MKRIIDSDSIFKNRFKMKSGQSIKMSIITDLITMLVSVDWRRL